MQRIFDSLLPDQSSQVKTVCDTRFHACLVSTRFNGNTVMFIQYQEKKGKNKEKRMEEGKIEKYIGTRMGSFCVRVSVCVCVCVLE